MFNRNGQKPTFDLPPEIPAEEPAQPTQTPQQVSREALLVQMMAEYMMQRKRSDADFAFKMQQELQGGTNQMIEQICDQIDGQVAEWQSISKALRSRIK